MVYGYVMVQLLTINDILCEWQAIRYIEYDSSFSDEEKQQAKALKISCNLNDAACKLKLKDYKQAEKLCTKVSLWNFLFCLFLLYFCSWIQRETEWKPLT